jgi:hypothetical protein
MNTLAIQLLLLCLLFKQAQHRSGIIITEPFPMAYTQLVSLIIIVAFPKNFNDIFCQFKIGNPATGPPL